MSPYILAPLAREDLKEIWDRIAEDDFDTADRVLDEIRSAIIRLTTRPLRLNHFTTCRNRRCSRRACCQ